MIKEMLINKKSSIVGNWIQHIVDTYPPETSKFLISQKNRFSNPVGYSISSSAENIVDEIVHENDIVKIKLSLIDLMKIRAVQDFSPSQAAGFIFSLKKAIRKELAGEIKDENSIMELLDIESRVDDAALIAFDLYTEAREKVFQIRVNELKAKITYDRNSGPINNISKNI